MSAELHQAFVVLLEGETGPVARAAMETIRTSALAMARADGRRRGDHDDCAQEVAFKLWKRLSMGDCPVRNLCAASCSAYVHRMVENWLTDRHRRDVTRRARRERAASSVEPPRSAEDEALSREEEARSRERALRVRALLERLALAAIERRQPRHRPHLEQGWREIERMVFEGVPLRSVLVASGELADGAGEGELVRARNAAYKRHQRTREALEEAATALARDGDLGPHELELARLAIAGLARCQRSEGGRVDEEAS